MIQQSVSLVEQLHSLVLHDERLTRLGTCGLARLVFQEATGRIPTRDEVRELVRDFWQYWHEQHDKPQRRFVIVERRGIVEDPDPSQENAIRVWEDRET